MGNVIKIKHGSNAPGRDALVPFELGYNTTTKELYIGDSGASTGYAQIQVSQWVNPLKTQVNLASSDPGSINGTIRSYDLQSATKIGVTGVLPIAHGGTGTGSRITKNRLCWTDDPTNGTASEDTVIAGDYHYVDKSSIAINAVALPNDFASGLYVNGDLHVNGKLHVGSNDTIGLYANSNIVIEHGASSGIYIGGPDHWFIIEGGQCKTSATACGYYLVDTNGATYAGLYDNGDDLWVGAKQAQDTHHVGKTYISAGYDSTTGKGNQTVYISVPNANNNDASDYEVLHSGTKHILLKGTVGNASGASYTDDSAKITFANSSTTTPQKVALVYSDKDTYFAPASLTLCGQEDGAAFIAPYLKGKFITTGYGTAEPSGTAKVGQLYFQVVS